jgi:uncharacterized membrane protein HdeD (DUF308 family)
MAQQPLGKKLADGARAAAPWRKGIPWMWVLIEGIVMLALGLIMLFAEAQTRLAFGVILSVALAIAGALQLLAAWRANQSGNNSTPGWVRGGVGLGFGLLMFILILLNAVSLQAARIILGLGCLGYGGAGAYIIYLKRAGGFRLTEILSSTIFVVMGILVAATAFGGVVLSTISTGISVLLMLLGAFLILWSLALRSHDETAPVA